jgi:glycosyltransferase involved in cell wall biosynthesis
LKILIITQYFLPENFIINDVAIELKDKGHEITILTGIPNYPEGNFYEGYGYLKKQYEVINGLEIYRAPILKRGTGSNLRLALNYISFIFGAIFRSFKLLGKSYDLIFVFEPSPITVCLPAIFIKKIKNIPICLWVLDLWPESLFTVGKLNSKLITKVFNPLIKYIYQEANEILVSSKGFTKSIKEKGVSQSKISFIPQWAETFFKPMKENFNLFKSENKNSFKIVFAGNIGESQDFPNILKAAKIIQKTGLNIEWYILGSGRKERWLQNRILEMNLSNCFHLLGRHPVKKMPEFFSCADCLLFSLKKNPIFSLTIPAKVQTYLACGKPIVGMIDGEASKIIKNGNAGLITGSEDSIGLAKNIKKMALMNKKELKKMGENGLKIYDKNFNRSLILNKLENILYELSTKTI